ncbi:tetratricopeptide repeat protein [Streptomyces justiciae]|uniref:tetratricopeptide repeat protein n=1 Tax=Streptomyces justiciae TaxID=2780140 RepID=UPI0021185901|nr:hypothetical protein [Streptomyces justiciae]MCW8379747.1 hypothetical protein [Streptomyces justiciae]
MSKTPNTRLSLLMQEADLNQAQLAATVAVVAAEHGVRTGCDRSSVSRWLSGTTPRPPWPALLLEALARRLGRPITAYEAGLSSVRCPVTVHGLSWEADPLRKLAALTSAQADPDRRRALTTGVFTLTALAVPDATALARLGVGPPRASASGPGRVGHGEIEHMQTMARLFAQAAEEHGAGHIRPSLAEYLNHSVTRWLHAPASDTIHRQLLTSAAQLTTLFGLMSADDGADALAQHYCRVACHLAADADDMVAFAIALRAMSAHAHELGHHVRAVHHLAERATDATRHAPPSVRAYVHAHLAVMQAHDDRYSAIASLAEAERLHDRANAAPGPLSAYPRGALYYQRAQTLTTLGDKRESIRALTASLHHRAPGERLADALTRARLAETLLAQGHLDAALLHWRGFLDVYPLLHSARATRRLDAMRQFLRPHRHHPAAAHLLARATGIRHRPR